MGGLVPLATTSSTTSTASITSPASTTSTSSSSTTTTAFPRATQDCEHRLRTTLGNIFRLRALWRLCFGASVPMRWASYDQKPSWFNNAGLKALYARKGASTVGAREDHHGTRQRYTVMTSVISWHVRDADGPPPCAILFKGDSERAPSIHTYERTYSGWGVVPEIDRTYAYVKEWYMCGI